MTSMLRKFSLVALFAGLFSATPVWAVKPANQAARLYVEDKADIFSSDAIEKAKRLVGEVRGDIVREAHVETYGKLDTDEQKKYAAILAKEVKDKDGKEDASLKDQVEKEKAAFWADWAKSKARGDRGILILVNMEPSHVHVISDRGMHELGFNASKEKELRETIIKEFRQGKDKPAAEKKKHFDDGLVSAAEYIKKEMPTHVKGSNPATKAAANGGGSNIGSYVCMGIAALLGIWLIVGLIRAFSGGGGGGGMGGGGGGGMFGSIMGGLFGAMAGMWLYNNLFGSSTPNSYGDTGTGPTEDGGAGDFNDGGTGGDFDSGGSGGGGGDFGGGGDWGGGGGDFGGGGGDF